MAQRKVGESGFSWGCQVRLRCLRTPGQGLLPLSPTPAPRPGPHEIGQWAPVTPQHSTWAPPPANSEPLPCARGHSAGPSVQDSRTTAQRESIPAGSGPQPPSSRHPHRLRGQHTHPGIICSSVSVTPCLECGLGESRLCPSSLLHPSSPRAGPGTKSATVPTGGGTSQSTLRAPVRAADGPWPVWKAGTLGPRHGASRGLEQGPGTCGGTGSRKQDYKHKKDRNEILPVSAAPGSSEVLATLSRFKGGEGSSLGFR